MGGKRMLKLRSLCLNNTVPIEVFSRAVPLAATLRTQEHVLHVIFIDDRRSPVLDRMEAVARLGAGSQTRFLALLAPNRMNARDRAKLSRWSASSGIGIQPVDFEALPPVAGCIHEGFARPGQGVSKRLRLACMLKPLLFLVLPKRVSLALVLDTNDLVPLRSFDALLGEADQMRRKGALLGLGLEQSRFYAGLGTLFGGSSTNESTAMAPGLRGYNGGVQLHDLDAMRASPAWLAILDAAQAGRLFPRIGYSGDQSLFNGLVSLFPHFFHTLSCGWNRQTASWVMKPPVKHPIFNQGATVTADLLKDTPVHACASPCAVLHLNGLKCAAKLMLEASGGCATWKAVLDRVEQGDESSCPERRDFTWLGPRKMGNSTFQSPLMVRMPPKEHGPLLAAGLRKWFGGCCRDVAAADSSAVRTAVQPRPSLR